MINDLNNTGYCDFCNKIKKVENTYFIYRISFITNIQTYTIGIQKIIKEMNPWIFKNTYHLSPTEIMLLRPDLLLKFMKERYDSIDEKVIKASLVLGEVCKKCFENTFITEVPER